MGQETDQLAARVAHLQAELAHVSEQRVTLEKAAVERGTLDAAIVAVSRDIDAATSPVLGALQDEVAALEAEVADVDATVDYITSLASQPLRGGVDLRQMSPPLWQRLTELLQRYRDLPGRDAP